MLFEKKTSKIFRGIGYNNEDKMPLDRYLLSRNLENNKCSIFSICLLRLTGIY